VSKRGPHDGLFANSGNGSAALWCHSLRHSSIAQAAELGRTAGLGRDKIRAHSRHRSIATLMLYVDEHDRQWTQATLADLVAKDLHDPRRMDG
jgi:integrase